MRRKERIYQMLKTIDMDYSRTKLTKVLSGGEQRRLSLAIELLSNPDIIFLDEVTSGLDPYAETKIMELLERIAKSGITIILITHATKNLSRCDKVLFLSKGEQRYFGTPEDSLRSFKVPDFDKIYEVI